VMCTDGRDNIKDYVSGTITEQVIIDAPCPVLVVPQKKSSPPLESTPGPL